MKRVAAYARVSTNYQGAEHSFAFQSNYWNDKFSNDPNVEYVGLYADQGISGKLASRRPKFMQLMMLAQNGGVDEIHCKSVQRFARNTEELLSFVHELRELGVAVIFEKENINTSLIESDLYLTIAAAVAEDDLSRYSQNMQWSFEARFQKGVVNMGGHLYGYFVGKNATFTINPEEAKIVREIYQLYLDGYSARRIANLLNERGVPGPFGGIWNKNTPLEIIKNEKYIGDVMLRKEVWNNGQHRKNYGQKDRYYIENHHEPIIDRETYKKCQDLCFSRANKDLIGRVQKVYTFTGLIKCGCCGKTVQHKTTNSGYDGLEPMWRCPSNRHVCTTTQLRDVVLKEKFVEAFNEFITKRHEGVDDKKYQTEIDELGNQQKDLIRLKNNGWISVADFDKEFGELEKKISDLAQKIEALNDKKLTEKDFRRISVFDENKVDKFLTKVVLTTWNIDFHFYNGVVISKSYKNRGDKEIWVKTLRKLK